MKIATIVISTLLSASFFNVAIAGSSACPSIGAIQNAGFDLVGKMNKPGVWGALEKKNKYDTQDQWTFALLNVQADNESDAMAKAKIALSTLSFSRGPVEIPGKFACYYNVGNTESAIAVTPPEVIGIPFVASLMK